MSLKAKFGCLSNLNMQNLMMLFTFFLFNRKYPFLCKFGPKNQNYQFKLKFDTFTNSNMQNSMMLFTFFCFGTELIFLGKFGPKNQNCQFKVKLDTQTNSNMENSMMLFTFFIFDQKYPFWANLIQKIKFARFRWDLIPRLIRIFRIQWWSLLFSFSNINTLFGQIWSKKSKLSV